jgi:hypothetical protein
VWLHVDFDSRERKRGGLYVEQSEERGEEEAEEVEREREKGEESSVGRGGA